MKVKSCCFIGHRKVNETEELVAAIKEETEKLINIGVTRFLFGKSGAFNNLCHRIVTDLKKKYPQIVRVAYDTKSEKAFTNTSRKKTQNYNKFF